mgnify:FL=1
MLDELMERKRAAYREFKEREKAAKEAVKAAKAAKSNVVTLTAACRAEREPPVLVIDDFYDMLIAA